ncbi:MAG: hypothetical protein M1834_002465 [Cirrosporium novae-zelandiae]|nr:MAG: hypothetical protein M1834_002465 [Cirrosporium novae-zelandiae]
MWGLDDWLVLAALLLCMGFSALGIIITFYGAGLHIEHVTAEELVGWLKIYYAAECSYVFVAFMVKASLLVFLRRIFPQRSLKLATSGILIFLALFTLSGCLVLAFQCSPVRAAYDKTILDAKCMSTHTLFSITMFQAVTMFITDIVILIIPIPIIWKLNMPLKKQLAVMTMFGSGIIAILAGIIRFSTLTYLKDGGTDVTYTSASSLIWMDVEFNLGLIAGSLSSLRVLPFFKTIFTSKKYSSGMEELGKGPSSGGKGYMLENMGRKKGSRSYPHPGESILNETKNESQERIIRGGSGDAKSSTTIREEEISGAHSDHDHETRYGRPI